MRRNYLTLLCYLVHKKAALRQCRLFDCPALVKSALRSVNSIDDKQVGLILKAIHRVPIKGFSKSEQ